MRPSFRWKKPLAGTRISTKEPARSSSSTLTGSSAERPAPVSTNGRTSERGDTEDDDCKSDWPLANLGYRRSDGRARLGRSGSRSEGRVDDDWAHLRSATIQPARSDHGVERRHPRADLDLLHRRAAGT